MNCIPCIPGMRVFRGIPVISVVSRWYCADGRIPRVPGYGDAIQFSGTGGELEPLPDPVSAMRPMRLVVRLGDGFRRVRRRRIHAVNALSG